MELARIHKKNISSRTAAERELMSNDESDDDDNKLCDCREFEEK